MGAAGSVGAASSAAEAEAKTWAPRAPRATSADSADSAAALPKADENFRMASARVLLARAALAAPRLLLIDAAAATLDPAGREALAALVATNDPALIRRMDLVWFVRDGRVVEVGPPAQMLDGDGPAARFLRPRQAA